MHTTCESPTGAAETLAPAANNSPAPLPLATGGGTAAIATPCRDDSGWLLSSDQVTTLMAAKGAQVILDQRNPKLEGSKSWAKYEAYKLAGTIGDFTARGGTRADVSNDFSRGYLRVPELATILNLNTSHVHGPQPNGLGGEPSDATLATIERLRMRIKQSLQPGGSPPPASVFYELGLCLEKTGDLCEAMKSFKSAILAPSIRPFSTLGRRAPGERTSGTMSLLEAAEAVEAVEKHVENVEAVKAVEQAIVEEKAEEDELSRTTTPTGGTQGTSPSQTPTTVNEPTPMASEAFATEVHGVAGVKRLSPYSAQDPSGSLPPHASSYGYPYSQGGSPPSPYGLSGYGVHSQPPPGYGYGEPPHGGYRDYREPGYGYGSYGHPHDYARNGYAAGDYPVRGPREYERFRYTDRPGGLDEGYGRSDAGVGAGARPLSARMESGEGGRGSGDVGDEGMERVGDYYGSLSGGKRRRKSRSNVGGGGSGAAAKNAQPERRAYNKRDDTSGGSGASAKNARGGRWTPEEHALFLKGKAMYGRSWTKVAEVVGTRTTVQVRSHAQKYEIKVQRESGQHSEPGAYTSWNESEDRSGDEGDASSSGNET